MISTLVMSIVAILLFGAILAMTGIVQVARHVLQTTAHGISSMMDPELTDIDKETAVRRAGFELIRASYGLFWRFACALCAAGLAVVSADAVGLVSGGDVWALMLQPSFIVVVSVVMILAVMIVDRVKGKTVAKTSTGGDYSATDRFFHELAFSSPSVLKSASWIEDRLIGHRISGDLQAPIFVTALARGGTTALLNALYDVPNMAAHIYRDMPFVTAPILWNWMSGGARRNVKRHQRAHGDGLEIDLDTPEAFEEIIWKLFWPEKYASDGIALWHGEDHKEDPEHFLRRHMAKIVRRRSIQGAINENSPARYLSKNNANISRIEFLLEVFPDCKIVVPVRKPECHVASLLRQHKNFLERHSKDDFSRRYMRDIGHFEFGMLHKPFLFDRDAMADFEPRQEDYWLQYWITVYRHVLRYRDKCIFVLQDDLRAKPQETMTTLCKEIGVTPGSMSFDTYFRHEPDKAATDVLDPKLFAEACAVYAQISETALSIKLSDDSETSQRKDTLGVH